MPMLEELFTHDFKVEDLYCGAASVRSSLAAFRKNEAAGKGQVEGFHFCHKHF